MVCVWVQTCSSPCLLPSPVCSCARRFATWRIEKYDFERPHFQRCACFAGIACVLPGRQTTVDKYAATLRQILVYRFGLALPCRNREPFGIFGPFTVLVAPVVAYSQAEIGDRRSTRGVAHFGVGTCPTYKEYLVKAQK